MLIVRVEPSDVREPPNNEAVVGPLHPNIQFPTITRSEPFIPPGHPTPPGPPPPPDAGEADTSDAANLRD